MTSLSRAAVTLEEQLRNVDDKVIIGVDDKNCILHVYIHRNSSKIPDSHMGFTVQKHLIRGMIKPL